MNSRNTTAQRRILGIIALVAITCRGETTTPPVVNVAHDPLLQHHEIRADQLPKPNATPSAGNPPVVMARPADAALHLPPGFHISIYASKLDDPRSMVVAPNGDLFLSEPGAGKITILRDTNHDGVAEQRFTFASDLKEPFGLAFHGDSLYVGNTNAVVRFGYTKGQTAAAGKPQQITALPGGGHSTRNVLFNRDGSKLYVATGSSSNVGVETDPLRAAITEFNPDGSGRRTFASGLRNPVALAWNPTSGALWTAVNERDGLGDDLVPDYITEVKDGSFYGWPFAYSGHYEEPRLKGQRPDLVAKATMPSLLLQAHSAALGLAFYNGTMFPAQYRGNAFIAMHGSWNRAKRTGYKVVSARFENGHAVGGYDDFVVGWSPDENSRRVWGRPVSLLVLPDGSLLISDDGAQCIWRVTYAK